MSHCPRRKHMSREARLQSAKSVRWVETYKGKNVIRGYCKWYGVDPLCAVIELRSLGVAISAEREVQLRRSAISVSVARKKKKVETPRNLSDSDDTFAFIAGYTPGGFPYGVTWEELGETYPQDEEVVAPYHPPTA
ncbi:MAG: hypothetical protein WCS52_04935 [bacterium]